MELTRERAIIMVRKNGLELQYVGPFKDREIILEAVQQNGMALEYVPIKMLDREIILEAVRKNGLAVMYVPIKMLDREIVLEAVRQNGTALIGVGPFKDREVILEAVRQNGLALGYVPESFKDREIILEAVHQNGMALGYVQAEMQDKDIIMTAIRQNGMALGYVPIKLRDKIICINAVQQNVIAYSFVPHELRQDIEIVGVLPPPPKPLKLTTQISETHSNQGLDKSCSFHANTRLILQNRFIFVTPIRVGESYVVNKCNELLLTDIKDNSFEQLSESRCSQGGYNKILLFLYTYLLYAQYYACGTTPIHGLVTDAIDKMEIPKILTTTIHAERLFILLVDLHKKSTGIVWQEFEIEITDVSEDKLFLMIQKVMQLRFYVKLSLSGYQGHVVTIVAVQENNYVIKNSWSDTEDVVPSIKFLYLQGVPFVGTKLTFYLPLYSTVTVSVKSLDEFSHWLDIYALDLKMSKLSKLKAGSLKSKRRKRTRKTKN